MTATTHHLELPDQHIAYAEASASDSTLAPLVLLHGGAVDHRMWTPQLTGLRDRRTIAPDARGHGGSSDAESPYSLADDVVALLDALEIERAVLAGVSMGGGTAVDVALEHPDRVAALVVSDTGTSEPTFTDPWCVEAIRQWRLAEQQGNLDAWVDAFMVFTVGPDRVRADVDDDVWELIETMARETVTQHLRVDATGIPIPPVPPTPVPRTWERLRMIEVPVLALCGAQDGPDHRHMGERLAEDVRHGEFTTVPGAHYPNLESPEAFDTKVQDFLRRHAR
jgi:3-oxoadipate enol-lactonase